VVDIYVQIRFAQNLFIQCKMQPLYRRGYYFHDTVTNAVLSLQFVRSLFNVF